MALRRPSPATLDARLDAAAAAVVRVLWAADAVLGAWRHRHQTRRDLRDLPPHLLRDIGLTAADAEAEARKPFWRA
jgi:uncharacterized protein YjiS (DUF1127 family)